MQLKEYLVICGSQPTSKVKAVIVCTIYCENIFIHLSHFMTKFTFEQCHFFWLLFRLSRNRTESFPVCLTELCSSCTAAWLAQLGERRSTEREVAGLNPGRTNTQGL